MAPPDVATVQRLSGATAPVFERHVRELIRDRQLARLDALLFHADALEGLRKDIQEMKRTTPSGVAASIDVATFKARYGLSRKYTIPLLEWLDRERITRRVGDRRVLL